MRLLPLVFTVVLSVVVAAVRVASAEDARSPAAQMRRFMDEPPPGPWCGGCVMHFEPPPAQLLVCGPCGIDDVRYGCTRPDGRTLLEYSCGDLAWCDPRPIPGGEGLADEQQCWVGRRQALRWRGLQPAGQTYCAEVDGEWDRTLICFETPTGPVCEPFHGQF